DVKFHPTPADLARWGATPSGGLGPDWRGAPDSDTYFSFMRGRLDPTKGKTWFDHDWANVRGAIDFIHHRPSDRPFCLYLPLTYPHPAYAVEEPWFSAVDRARLPARIPAPDKWDGKPCILEGIWRNQRMRTWTEDRWSELRATYYGMCARVTTSSASWWRRCGPRGFMTKRRCSFSPITAISPATTAWSRKPKTPSKIA
ncbi:MAG: hypothetical protein M1457_13110, partial [bacterium]|nr:hypothetical protein [bacterium]